ncbi:MAG: two-component sensor histidine kinase [Rhodocyclaceae bacterium]|nr:two-component sensor histidine kinase [Rhodocyclaceae bacterium]
MQGFFVYSNAHSRSGSPFHSVTRPATIRKTLLGAFLLVALAPAILLAGLAFVKARRALQAEIEQSLSAQAAAIAADLDKVMFERLQNAAIWSQLEVMQDLQVQDVDRRLSGFLAKLREGYGGVYRSLAAANPAGSIVASSDPAELGGPVQVPPPWQQVQLSGTTVSLSLQAAVPGGDGATLQIQAPIPSHLDATRLGQLRLRFDWRQVEQMLDRAGGEDRMVAVLDRAGRVVAASQGLRTRPALPGAELAGWAFSRPAGAYVLDPSPLGESAMAVGLGQAASFAGFDGLGWRTLVMEPLDAALAPVRHMVAIALALLLALIVATLAMATWVSGAIARPIVALTDFTRQYRRDRSLLAVPPGGPGEVGELSTAFVDMMRDIDESQRNLVRASKLAVVGEMSAVIAHEVRTPLGILRSSAQMLQREPGLSQDGRELTGFIESETERLNRLVSTLLDSARQRAAVFAPVDLHALVRRCLGMVAAQAAKKRVSFEERLAARDPLAEVDAEQLTQVLLNLIMNALQLVPEGGKVQLGSADAGEVLELCVGDDGPGIPAGDRERVFEAFFFRREGGVGLGLAIVQQIIQAHGGSIVADQSPLGGALFRIRLPRRIPTGEA